MHGNYFDDPIIFMALLFPVQHTTAETQRKQIIEEIFSCSLGYKVEISVDSVQCLQGSI